MGRNRVCVILALALLVLGCVTNKDDINSSQFYELLKQQKITFGKDYNVENLLSHFPETTQDSVQTFYVANSTCPPSFDCLAQFGEVYLVCKSKSDNDSVVENAIFKTKYSCDSNIVVNVSELRKDIFPNMKCNIGYDNKYPIPYFERYNFGIGKKELKKELDGDTIVEQMYTVPSDLFVYVIDAKAGNFWKENCNERRPDSLRDWKNGYSKGIAISRRESIIVYWTMIW